MFFKHPDNIVFERIELAFSLSGFSGLVLFFVGPSCHRTIIQTQGMGDLTVFWALICKIISDAHISLVINHGFIEF